MLFHFDSLPIRAFRGRSLPPGRGRVGVEGSLRGFVVFRGVASMMGQLAGRI
jgi:hypothetical protein